MLDRRYDQMKKLVTTALTNTIWWATVNEKNGTMNTDTRIDVTDNAVYAVFQHLTNMKGFRDKGFAGYEIPKKNSDEFATIATFKSTTHVCIAKELYEELMDYKKKYEELVAK